MLCTNRKYNEETANPWRHDLCERSERNDESLEEEAEGRKQYSPIELAR